MSELKGQLIGIMLVITVFMACGGLLLKGYKDATRDVIGEVGGQYNFVEPND